MIRLLVLLCSGFCAVALIAAPRAAPVRLILDTDMGNDIDDALALAMIHNLQTRGEVTLLAVTITKDNRFAAPYVDLVNTAYGRPEIPIGVVRNGRTPEDAAYIRVPSEARDEQGHALYPHRLASGTQAAEAVALLQKTLAAQPDHSVTIAQIGFSTNLARLLQVQGGRNLVSRKVKLLALMAGNFSGGEPEYNIYKDPAAAAQLLRNWPTPMVFSGFEIGQAIPFPYETYATGFAHAATNPVVAAAKSYFQKPEDRPAWDPTAVLYAARPRGGYFQLSERGNVTLGAGQRTLFIADPKGRCQYLILDPAKKEQVQRALVDLVTGSQMEPAAGNERTNKR